MARFQMVPFCPILSRCTGFQMSACGDPEIAFANSFKGPLKKPEPASECTNRRPFKLAITDDDAT